SICIIMSSLIFPLRNGSTMTCLNIEGRCCQQPERSRKQKPGLSMIKLVGTCYMRNESSYVHVTPQARLDISLLDNNTHMETSHFVIRVIFVLQWLLNTVIFQKLYASVVI
uniref:Uncharacterized protein n=1 Tax=Cyprinus carpio carpio TaxID=630221 RepID=A0A9J7ZA68_CYPCA